MMTAERLEQLIAAGLPCSHLAVEGDGQHWAATVVSEQFEGKRLIARHKMVYATLGDKIDTNEVHALSIKAYTPTEWQQQTG